MNDKPSPVFKLIGTFIGVLLWTIGTYYFWGRALGYISLVMTIICVGTAVKQAGELGSRRG